MHDCTGAIRHKEIRVFHLRRLGKAPIGYINLLVLMRVENRPFNEHRLGFILLERKTSSVELEDKLSQQESYIKPVSEM